MIDPAQLATLAEIHRRGSFDAAAAVLGLTPSAVSQRIRALEDRVGSLLIRRGVPCVATAAGLRLVRHHDELAALEAMVMRDLRLEPGGPVTLRLAVNADSLATWVIPALAATEGLLFDLVIDDQAFSQDWLRRGDVLAAVTSHPGPLQGCDTVPLGWLRYHATASPGFMARWMPGGADAAALAVAPGLSFSPKDRLQEEWVSRVLGRRIVMPAHGIASAQGFLDAALAGLGWGMNPAPLVAGFLARGELVELIPDTPLDVPLYWQFARHAQPLLAPVTRALSLAAARVLRPFG